MRLAIVLDGLYGGGAERVTQTLSRYWVETCGWQVDVITLDDVEPRYALAAGVRHVRLPAAPHRLLRPLWLPIQALALGRWLREARVDGAVSLLLRANLCFLLARQLGAHRGRVVVSERNQPVERMRPHGVQGRAALRALALLYPRADQIVCISHGLVETLVALGVPRERCVVIHNPQPLAELRRHRRSSVPWESGCGRPFTVATAARLVPQKDHATLLRAVAIAAEAIDVRLVLLGDGRERPALVALAAHLGIEDRVSFHGWTDAPHEQLARADAFALSSRYEGFGNVLVEAMAIGLPVVATDCPSGPREILADGQSGVLVPVGDAEGVAHALVRLAQDAAHWREQRNEGLRRADDFDVPPIADRYVSAVLGRGKGGEAEPAARGTDAGVPQ